MTKELDKNEREARTVEEGLAFANKFGYPVAVCPLFSLNKRGKAAYDEKGLTSLLATYLRKSRVGTVELMKIPAGLCLARRPRLHESIRPSPNPVG